MLKKLSKKPILTFFIFPIVFCLIVISGIFLSDAKISSFSHTNQNAPANATVKAELGSNEAVLFKNWKSKLRELVTAYYNSIDGYNPTITNFTNITITKDVSKIPSSELLNVTSNPDNSSNLVYAKGFSLCATDETGTTWSDSGDIMAYITGKMPYISVGSYGYNSYNNRTVDTTIVIYSAKNIFAPVDSSSLFASNYYYGYGSYDRIESLTLENFNTQNTTNMSSMFRYYKGTKLDLSKCDFETINVKNMSYMFANTKLKTAGLDESNNLVFNENFRTLNVENMSYMFAGNSEHNSYYSENKSSFTSINLAFQKFSTLNVTSMSNMFQYCFDLTSLTFGSSFNTIKVENMSYMFSYCTKLTSLNLDGATFNTQNVKNMSHMFEYSGFKTAGSGSGFGLNFGSRFDISSATDLSYMFAGDEYYRSTSYDDGNYGVNYLETIDFSGWLTPRSYIEDFNVNFSYMFHKCKNLTSVNFSDNFYVDNVTDMSNMFYYCSRIRNLYFGKNFKPQDVTSFAYMFYNCTSLVGVDFTYFQTKNATNFSYMFYNCYNFTSLDLRAFNTEKVTSFSNMFAVKSDVVSRLAGLTLGFNTSSATDMSYMFAYCSGLTSLDLSSFNTSKVTNMSHMFFNCSGFSSVGSNDISQDFALNLGNTFYTVKVTNMDRMFSGCSGTKKFNLSVFNTSLVSNMTQMFYDCSLAKSIILGSTFTTNNIAGTNMNEMFTNCTSLETLDLSLFDTTRVTTGANLFYNCARLKHLTLGQNFTMQNATTLAHMFDNCDSLEELDVTMFNTSKVTDMSYLFSGCSKLTELDLSSFNTSSVTTMWNMFSRCSELTSVGISTVAIKYSLNIGYNFDTSNVTDMSSMFAYCNSITEIHLGDKFNTSNVTNMGTMFFSCMKLTDASFVQNFDVTNVKDMSSLFGYCSSLSSIDLSNFVINGGVAIVGIIDACTSLEEISCPTINAEKMTTDLPTIYTPLKGSSQTYRQLSTQTNGKHLYRAGNFLYNSFRVILGSELCQRVATLTITKKLSESTVTKNIMGLEQLEQASVGGVYSVGTANTSGTLYSNTSLLKAYMLKSSYTDENGDIMYDCVIYSHDMIVYAPENCEYIFAGNDGYNSYFSNLKYVYFDGFDTTYATTFKSMFANCGELRYLDVNKLVNADVENYDDMLLNCRKLVYIYTFANNGFTIELPGAYYVKNSSSNDEIREFPAIKTELSKRFLVVLDITSAENFSAEGWTKSASGRTAEKVFSYGASVGELPTITHGNRIFTGWGTMQNDEFVPYSQNPNLVYDTTEDLVLIPSWAQVYVTFDLRDGYYDTYHVLSATSTEEKEYISELNNTTITATRAVFQEKDLPANWSTIFDGTKILMYCGEGFGDLPAVYKDDYELLGWKMLSGGQFALSNTVVPVDATASAGEIGEVKLYADWIFAENPERWRFITFDTNGGRIDSYRSVRISTSVVSEYDDELEDFKTVTKLILEITNASPHWDISHSSSQITKKYYVGRLYDVMPYTMNSGYKFAGWWTARDGGELIESTEVINEDTTLYAHWEKIDEDFTLNQQTLIIVAIIVVVAVVGGIVMLLIKKTYFGTKKVVTINEKFIENFNKNVENDKEYQKSDKNNSTETK